MYLSQFLEYLSLEKKYAGHTIKAYKADVCSFEVFFKQQAKEGSLEEVNYSQIRSWIVSLVDKGVSNRTINRKVSSLKAYYKFLVKTDCIQVNPLANHKVLKVAKKLQIPFSKNEIVEVLDLLKEQKDFEGLRDRLIIELFYSTGIRRVELINLRLADVDLVNKQIKVLGKRNKERYIPLLPSVLETVREYISAREILGVIKNSSYLLLTKKGIKIYETLVYRVVNHYFSKASSKVKKSPHIIRHSFATHLLNEGADLNAVKELLGHSSLAATQVYTNHSVAQLNKVYQQSHPRNKK